VFQNDIRRGLMRVGTRSFFVGAKRNESRLIEESVAAATDLARHRIGAIICFEQDASLDEFVASPGTAIDAAVNRDLLVSIFIPEGINKLHDGAVIIRNLRIASAGVFFPMPDSRSIDQTYGSRHRAAIGITEETDAVVVVVSEERGNISVCVGGNILPNLDGPQLREALTTLLGGKKPAADVKPSGILGKAFRKTDTSRSTAASVPTPADSEPALRNAAGETNTSRLEEFALRKIPPPPPSEASVQKPDAEPEMEPMSVDESAPILPPVSDRPSEIASALLAHIDDDDESEPQLGLLKPKSPASSQSATKAKGKRL
jgi:diadenylate cyclase